MSNLQKYPGGNHIKISDLSISLLKRTLTVINNNDPYTVNAVLRLQNTSLGKGSPSFHNLFFVKS